MFDSALILGILIGLGLMFTSATDFRQIMTNLYATKRKTSFGVKAISSSVKQLRVWYFLIGLIACAFGLIGILAPAQH